MADTKRMLEVLEMIIADVENDVSNFEGKPFNGKIVAEYFGNQAAAIQALAKIVKADIESRITPHEPDSATCGECGNKMEHVRPGKWQCNYCESRQAGCA